MVGGVNYEWIDDEGLYVSYGEVCENLEVIVVDNVVICVGQFFDCLFVDVLEVEGVICYVIGGVDVVVEFDVKCVINQGVWLVVRF